MTKMESLPASPICRVNMYECCTPALPLCRAFPPIWNVHNCLEICHVKLSCKTVMQGSWRPRSSAPRQRRQQSRQKGCHVQHQDLAYIAMLPYPKLQQRESSNKRHIVSSQMHVCPSQVCLPAFKLGILRQGLRRRLSDPCHLDRTILTRFACYAASQVS